MTKKLMRFAVVAFALTVLLAISSFAAYTVNIDGTLNGLEDGVDYTYARYDFVTEAWGEYSTLTASTELTPGVWGVKAGEEEVETVFVNGAANGEITFWNTEKDTPAYNTAGTGDYFLPGKWNVSKNSAARTVAFYDGKTVASICIYLRKEHFLVQVESTTQDTVTVDGTAYPLYAIDGEKYYLKDEAYYKTADNTLYDGEAEATPVYKLTWVNSNPLIGDKNLLQEIVVRYGFTDEQIVPAKDVISFPNNELTIKTGGIVLNDGYQLSDIKGTFTYVVKTPGVEGYQRYVTEIDAGSVGRAIPAPAEMADSEGYLVAIEYAPYVNTPDDIFKGNSGDTAAEVYGHIYLKRDLNVINYTAHLVPGPEGLVNGHGTIGGLDSEKTYQVAAATINAGGDGISLGEWVDFDPDSRSLVGLYAVREIYGDITSDVSYAFSYGNYLDRAAIGGLGEDNKTVLVTGGANFVPGHYSGHYTTYYTGTLWQIMSHGQVDSSYMLASMNAQKAYDALVATGTATEDELAEAQATLVAKNTALIDKINQIVLRYTFDKDEIVPVDEVNSFKIFAIQNNGTFTLKSDYQSKVVAYVADSTGEIKTYEQTMTQPFRATNAELTFNIDFTSFLPDEGYLVAFELYPCTNVTLETFGKVTAQYSFRFYTKVIPSNYSIDRPEELPVIEGKPDGLTFDATKKIISGLDADERYEYVVFNISGNKPEEWKAVPAGATSFDVSELEGMIAVRYRGDGITSSGSGSVYYYIPGADYENILHTTEIVGTNGAYKDVAINVPVVQSALDTTGNTIEYKEGVWTGIALSNALAREYGFAPLTLGTTSTPISVTLAKNIKTAQAELDALGADASADAIAAAEAKLAAAQKAAADRSASIYYSYAYETTEIIPMSDFVSFKYSPRVRQTGFKANGTVYTKFVFKVIDENHQLVDRVVLKPVTYGYNESVTITKEDFADTTGYIVAMVVYPFGYIDGAFAYSADINGDYSIVLFADGYKATRNLPAAEMTKLDVDGDVVSGFDPAYVYEAAAYTMSGASGEWTEIEGDTFTLTNTGLTAIRIKADNVNYDHSEPQIFYLAGKTSERKAISELKEDGSVVYAATTEFIPGVYTGTRVTYMNDPLVAKEGAHIHLDQVVGGFDSPEYAEKIWLLTHTQEEAQAALDAEASKVSQYPGTVESNTYYPARLQAVIDEFYADETRDIEAELAAIREKIAQDYKKSYTRYAYASNEIIPVDELKSITFYNKSRQGAVIFYTKSVANFYVMDENGVVTPYSWTSDLYYNKYYSEHIHTINVQEEVDLPENGWIVGIEFIPFAEIVPETVNAESYTRLAYKSRAYAFEQNHVNVGFYYDNYEIEFPTISKPAITFADGKFSGLEVDKTYAYGRFTANGIETTEVTGVTEIAVSDFGIWGIKELSTDNEFADSLFVMGYNKDLTTARDSILHLVDYTKTNGEVIQVPAVVTAGAWNINAAPIFNEATWTGFSLNNALVNHGYTNLILGTTSCTIGGGSYATQIKNATNDAELEAARKGAENALASIYYSYEYTPEETIPMNEFVSWSFKVSERQGSLQVLEGSLQTKFVFKVATENGVVDRAVYKDAVFTGAGTNHTVSISDFEETDGYIVGIVIYPYGNCPEGTVIGVDAQVYNNVPISEDINVILGTDYKVVPAVIVPAETPILTLGVANADIVITNYNELVDYAYSCDGGNTWVALEGKSFRATKASTEYVVKALANAFYEESAVSEAVVSPAVTVVGRSLVLDGQIGIKVYMDIDTDLVQNVVYNTTKRNSDYANADEDIKAAEYRKGGAVNFVASNKWMTNIQLDEETGYYYVIAYVPAKDVDNIYFEAELNMYLKSDPATRVLVNNIGFDFTTYIEQAKELAEAGDAAFVEALPLVEALEAYVAYADNYFNKGTDDAYSSTASTADVEAATRTNATLTGVEFYGTSLILEDQVTIRHYFTVSDIDAFNAAYDVAGKYGVKGNFIYFDIADIPAQDIGKVQTLTIADAADNAVYTVTYSVANYIVDMMDDDDANLVSLVNAMYDYYLAAEDYAK